MNSKMKLVSVFCAAAMLATAFAGCSGNGNNGSTNTSSTDGSTPPASSTESTEPQKVENIVWYVGGNAPNQTEAVIKALNEKSAADIGVTVDFKFITSSEQDAVKSALAAGDDDVDIAFSCSWFADYRSSALNNYFVDLTELLPEKAPGLYEKLPSVLWEGMKVGGRIYGVPTWKDTAETQFWIGRKEILDKAGATDDFNKGNVRLESMTSALEKVKAWHDADPTANPITEAASSVVMLDQRGDWSLAIEWDKFLNDLEIGVKNFSEANPTVQWMYDDPDFVSDLKTLKKWADSGISNGIAAAQVESHPDGTISRGVGWDGAQYTVWGGEAVGYETLLAPAGGPFLKSTAALGSANCIPLNSKKIDSALKYLEYINTNAEYRNMLAYGVEGVNFEVVDGKYKSLTGYDWVAPNYTMASFDMLYAPTEVPDADMYKTICDGVFTAPANTLTGFSLDQSPVQNEVAACSSIVNEYAYALHRGAVADVDVAIAQYKEKLQKLGLQTIIDELQKQVDAFVASK